jgi:SAM-dependent methyltransferase
MTGRPLFTGYQYLKKIINSFCPRLLLACSPWKSKEKNYWAEQDRGDIHGYDKYCQYDSRIGVLTRELEKILAKDDSILDLGCNCGLYLHEIRKTGFTKVTGIDISRTAVEYGRNEFGFSNDQLIIGSFDKTLPKMKQSGRHFTLVYSMGATLEIVHPSFDIIRAVCDIADKYVILMISEWDHLYPRFWEYEFNRQGFLLMKSIRPFDGGAPEQDPSKIISLLVFQKIPDRSR